MSADKKVLVAVLKDGIYMGTKEIPESEVSEAHITFGEEGCDLPPNKYRWDVAKRAFIYLGRVPVQEQMEALPLNAFAWSLLAQWNATKTLPSQCMSWLEHYVQTIDFLGTFGNDEERDMLVNFNKARGL